MALVIALLLGIHVAPSSATFTFRHAPGNIRAAYATSQLTDCGAGNKVALKGAATLVVHFVPARTSLAIAKKRRIEGQPGSPVVELAKVCDFESDLGWAIGVDRQRAYRIARNGTSVVVTFR